MHLMNLIIIIFAPDIIASIRYFDILGYLISPSNALDWCHFALMCSGWFLWYAHVDRTSRLTLAAKYDILYSPLDQTPARMLLTNAEDEKLFLQFSHSLSDLEQGLRNYTNVTSLCGDV